MLYVLCFIAGFLAAWLVQFVDKTWIRPLIVLRPPKKECDHSAFHFPPPEKGLPRQVWCHFCGKVKVNNDDWVTPTVKLRKYLKTPRFREL